MENCAYILYRKAVKGETMEKFWTMQEQINDFVWGKYMISFLLFCGLWLMIRTGFLPFRKVKLIYHKTLGSLFQKKKKGKGTTSFQAVATALAGTLGVGSVVGVATALTVGGPGALFWMWISALLGMMIKYGEVVLAIYYREKQSDGTYIGGPMTTLANGCHMKVLGVIFALLCIFASFGIGNLAPANTIATTIQAYLPIKGEYIGIVLIFIVAYVIIGNGQRIMRFNEIIIPLVSILYIVACVYLLFLHGNQVIPMLKQVVQDAFTFQASVGGVGGFVISKAIHYGIARGVFSNEAGMGSSPISHASVHDVHPIEQGFWGIFEVFFDTIVVCTLTGMVILISGLLDRGLDGVTLSVACFEQGFGTIGGILFAISIVSFAIPSILGWYYYARECILYLFTWKGMLVLYKIVFLAFLLIGSLMELSYVWEIADTLNGLMMIPNLISLVFLQGVVVKLTKEYLRKHRSD